MQRRPSPREGPTQIGTLRGTRHDFAFFRPDGGGDDIFVAPENKGGALHGDRVEVVLFRKHPRDFRMEASVARILDRGERVLTGDVVRLGRTAFVVPDEALLGERLPLITGRFRVAAGEKILFHLDRSDREGRTSPRAVVDEIVGEGGDPSLDDLVVATQFRLEVGFPSSAEEEAAEARLRDDDRPRDDLRGLFTLTIDPIDAKDFDDALSLALGPDGRWDLKVHIADVAHAVVHDGPLDLEARRRGTSTYFPGRVLPMIPEVLSAGDLSLRPGEDRRVLTAHVVLSPEGEVLSSRLGESLIQSDARLHYDQALGALREEAGLGPELDALLRDMRNVSQAIRRRRFRDGGFDLSVPETEMTLDGGGVPVDLWRSRSNESHQIVEEFMIVANRAACAFAVERDLPFLFRVHQEPDPASLEQFLELAISLKPSVRWRDLEDLPKLRRWLSDLPENDPITRVLHYVFLRSLKKAVYSAIDVGHFGLGLSGYGHFTSPIRRYPDLWNHRIIKWCLRHPGRPVPQDWEELARSLAISTTQGEQRSERAERELVRIKVLRWAERRLGETHPGRVVACQPQGLYVELDDYPVSGFVPRDEMPVPSRFLDGRMSLKMGRRGGEIRLGDPVEVQLVRVDLRQRWLDMGLVKGPPGVGRLDVRGDRRPAGRRRAGTSKAARRKPRRRR